MTDSVQKMIIRNPNGTYTRLQQYPTVPADPDHPSVLSKDITINATKPTWLRLFVPRRALAASPAVKLPLVVFLHGGGFISCSPANEIFHVFCSNMAERLCAVVASVEYRLAPEHRLPAAYDDAVEALEFVATSQETWLRDYADVSNCFLMGGSAGANIVYHAGVRVSEEAEKLKPLRIRGLILHQLAIGGTARTGSELRLAGDPRMPMSLIDMLWDLGLPVGADRDHEYCNINPTAGDKFDRIRDAGWSVFVSGGSADPLVDRQVEFAGKLEKAGVRTVAQFGKGAHGMEVFDPSAAEVLFSLVNDFITAVL